MRVMIRVKRAPKSRPEDLGTMVMSTKKGAGDKFVAKLAELLNNNCEVHLNELMNLGSATSED